jgi:maltose/moltooligosaccharide transporter
VIGYCSDRTWTRLGRRRPYFLAGALLAATALVLMPRSPGLWVAAALLWLLDGSINVSMEPFRAFVGDQLHPRQRPAGYSMQSFFIGLGAVVASMLPWLFERGGASNGGGTADSGVTDTVRYSFEIGAGVLLASVLWTVLSTREYSPQELLSFDDAHPVDAAPAVDARRERRQGLAWAAGALVAIALIYLFALDRELYLVGAGALVWGLAQWLHGRGLRAGAFTTFMGDLATMPLAMRRLAPVQFFSWLAFFSMWIYTTAAVAQVQFGSTDPHSEAFNRGANWVGVLFGAYNGFAALAAAVIPFMVRRFGLRVSHLVNVWLGAAALLSFLVIRDPHWLLASMVGMGFAWASVLSLPYALLSDSLPAQKMGLYMGVFNFFIVIPQLVAATVLGFLLHTVFGGAPIYALAFGGASFVVAGLLVLRVPEPGALAGA